jgi:phospholipid/cholesterol/gamma-HCH transport system substrate-binding protein
MDPAGPGGAQPLWQRAFRWRPVPDGERRPVIRAGRVLAGWRDRLAAMSDMRLAAFAAMISVLAAAIAAGAVYLVTGQPGTTITAYFHQAIALYPGTTVDVLGVSVGTVNSVQPDGQLVKVTMTVNHGVAVPAGADAAVIEPSVISGRFVQLLPAYTGGPQMKSNAVIPVSRTVTPVEIDQIYSSISKLTQDLGPNGVNKNGAFSNALNTGAANLNGNGKAFATMIQQFGAAMRTLSSSQGNFFGTINNLQQFTAMLNNNDSQVRLGEQQLSQVFGFLSADRQNLAGALNELATALNQVKGFVQGNRGALKSDISQLMSITQLLVNQRKSLAEALDVTPLAADNFLNAYSPVYGSLAGRGNLNEISMGPGACTGTGACGGSGQTSSAPLPLPATGSSGGGGG